MMKKFYLRNFFIILFLLVTNLLKAQGPSDPGDGDPENIPLDPGTWVLVAAGVGYGVKKWKDEKQANKKNSLNTTADFKERDLNEN